MWRQAARSARPGKRSAPVRWRAAVLRTARLPWYSPFPQPIWASADLALAVAGQGAVVVRQLGPVAAGAPQGGVVQHVDIAAHPGAARQLHLGIAAAPATPAETGRAAGRERVGQASYIWGGARSIKK